jgi:hypothetical protein
MKLKNYKYNAVTGIKGVKTKLAIALSSLALIGGGAGMSLALFGSAHAASPSFGLQPFVYDPGNACTGIQAAWDNSTGNPAPSVLLTKPCPTTTNAASGIDIVAPSVEGQPVSNLTELNFDYKTGDHCGAGAPRFNLQLDQAGNQNAFLGCLGGTQTPTGNGYTHVEYSAAQIQAAVVAAGGSPTSTLYDLYIIFDEGNDIVGQGTPGVVHLDNISVNNNVVGSPTSATSKDDCKKNGWMNLTDQSGNSFKNQGQCVSNSEHNNGVGQDDVHAKNR